MVGLNKEMHGMQLIFQNKQPYNNFLFQKIMISIITSYDVNTAKNLFKKPNCLLEIMLSNFKNSYIQDFCLTSSQLAVAKIH